MWILTENEDRKVSPSSNFQLIEEILQRLTEIFTQELENTKSIVLEDLKS